MRDNGEELKTICKAVVVSNWMNNGMFVGIKQLLVGLCVGGK